MGPCLLCLLGWACLSGATPAVWPMTALSQFFLLFVFNVFIVLYVCIFFSSATNRLPHQNRIFITNGKSFFVAPYSSWKPKSTFEDAGANYS